MSESVIESATSSASSIAVKTTVVGGTGLGAPAAIPFMQAHHVWVFSLAEVCQLIATIWILYQLYVVVKSKIAAIKAEPKKEINRPSIMGGNSGGGHGASSSGSSSSSGSGEEENERED